jgi:hypothetical protein
MAFEVSEQHLDLLALVPGKGEGLGAGQRSRLVPGLFVEFARDLPGRCVGTTARLKWTATAVEAARPIAVGFVGVYLAGARERLATGADVAVTRPVTRPSRPRRQNQR